MKQGRDTGNAWQDESDPPPHRWRRRLAWLVLLAAVVAAGYVSGLLIDPAQLMLLSIGLVGVGWLWRVIARRRRRRLWHDAPQVVRSVLQRPVRPVPVEREWRFASHPAFCVPLALSLAGMLYWAAVLNRMQLPFYWLLALALLLIANLWCWRQPWLLVLIVSVCVGMLSLFGWLAAKVSVAVAIVVMLAFLAIGAAGIARIAQRINRNSNAQ